MPDHQPTLTAREFKNARIKLDLTREQFAWMLGYQGANAREQIVHMERGHKPIRAAIVRLVQAYLEGYRPGDWGAEGPDIDAHGVADNQKQIAVFDGRSTA